MQMMSTVVSSSHDCQDNVSKEVPELMELQLMQRHQNHYRQANQINLQSPSITINGESLVQRETSNEGDQWIKGQETGQPHYKYYKSQSDCWNTDQPSKHIDSNKLKAIQTGENMFISSSGGIVNKHLIIQDEEGVAGSEGREENQETPGLDQDFNNIYHYIFDKQQAQSNECEDEKEIEALDYCDQYYITKQQEEGEAQVEDGSASQHEDEDDVFVISPKQQQPVATNNAILDSSVSAKPQVTKTSKGASQVVQTTAQPQQQQVREVRYTVYGENLEASLKLMCCMKNISLVDKKDPKYKRMFITATHTKPASASQVAVGNDNLELSMLETKTQFKLPSQPSSKVSAVVADGQGGPTKKLVKALDEVTIYQPKQLLAQQVIDLSNRQLILSRMKKLFETIGCIGQRYCDIEDYRQGLLQDLVSKKPLKRKKLYSFINPENLHLIKNHQTEGLKELPFGGLRAVLLEFDLIQNKMLTQRLQQIKIIKQTRGPYYYQQPRRIKQNSTQQVPNPLNQQNPQPQLLQTTTTANGRRQSGGQTNPSGGPMNPSEQQILETYKRFRYNFHYWLKNFKYNEDGTLQFVQNNNNQNTGNNQPAENANEKASIEHTIKKLPSKKQLVLSNNGSCQELQPAIIGLEEQPQYQQQQMQYPTKIKGKRLDNSSVPVVGPDEPSSYPRKTVLLHTPKNQGQQFKGNQSGGKQEDKFSLTNQDGQGMVAGIDQPTQNMKKNFFVLGPNGINNITQNAPTDLAITGPKTAKNIGQQQIAAPSPQAAKPADLILDSLLHLKKHQEDIKRRRFKPASSPLNGGASHDNGSKNEMMKTPNSQLKKSTEEYDKLRISGLGGRKSQEQMMDDQTIPFNSSNNKNDQSALECTLNLRSILGVPASGQQRNAFFQQKQINTSELQSMNEGTTNQQTPNSMSRHSRHSQNLKMEAASKTTDLTEHQTPSKWAKTNRGGGGIALLVDLLPNQGTQNSSNSVKPSQQFGHNDTLRFKHQPHSSVLASGLTQVNDFRLTQDTNGGGIKFVQGLVNDKNATAPIISTKYQKAPPSPTHPIQIEDLISAHLQQQAQLHNKTLSGTASGSVTSAIDSSFIQKKRHQSSNGSNQYGGQQFSGNMNNSFERSDPITNLYSLMKQGNGNLNTVMFAKSNINNQQSSTAQLQPLPSPPPIRTDYHGKHRSNYKIGMMIQVQGGYQQLNKDTGGASLRSLRTIDSTGAKSMNAHSGKIHSHILPQQQFASKGNMKDYSFDSQKARQGFLDQSHQQQMMGTSPLVLGSGQNHIEDYSQYPPGTIFFDKLKRKSAAIINFMNYMSGSSTTMNSTALTAQGGFQHSNSISKTIGLQQQVSANGPCVMMPKFRNNPGPLGAAAAMAVPLMLSNKNAGRQTPLKNGLLS